MGPVQDLSDNAGREMPTLIMANGFYANLLQRRKARRLLADGTLMGTRGTGLAIHRLTARPLKQKPVSQRAEVPQVHRHPLQAEAELKQARALQLHAYKKLP
jgi:hypothetical protein